MRSYQACYSILLTFGGLAYGAKPALSPVRVELGDTTGILRGTNLSPTATVAINNQSRASSFSMVSKNVQELTISLNPGDSESVGSTELVTVTNPDNSFASTALTVYTKTGTVLTTSTFDSVNVYSNGKNVGTPKGQYQCVELIKRYYAQLDPARFGSNGSFDSSKWSVSTGYARDYFTENPAGKGLIQVQNNGSPLLPGDIVVFDSTSTHPEGHVAIIDSVVTTSSTEVEIIEQNWSSTGRAKLSLDSTHKLLERGSFAILGLLRSAAPVNLRPVGNFDGIDTTTSKVFGWAEDVDDLSLPVQVHIYIDKNAGTSGALPVATTAAAFRSDVGYHAFNYILPSSYNDGQTHTVWVWAIDLTDPVNHNTLLPGSPKTFSIAAPNQPPSAGFLMISDNLSAVNGQTLNVTVPPGGSAPVSVSAGASHANVPGGSIVGWSWSVNGTQISTAPSFGRAFETGTYQISLVVTDSSGLQSSAATGTVMVTETAPRILYSVNYHSNNISAYSIDSSTGALTPIPGSPLPGGSLPDWITINPSNKFAYVTNCDGNSVSGFAIIPATGGLTAVPGSPFVSGNCPYGVGVDPLNRFVYVNNQSDNNLSGYAINQRTGVLTPVAGGPFPSGPNPVYSLIFHPNGRFVYNLNLNGHTLSGFAIDPLTGALTPLPASPFDVSDRPTSLAIDPPGKHLYLTLASSQWLYGFNIDATTGNLSPIVGSPFDVGLQAFGLAADPKGRFLFVCNAIDNAVTVYAIDQTSGVLSIVSGSPFPAGITPESTAVDPFGNFLYVGNVNGNNISGFRIDQVSGSLAPVPGSPFGADGQPVSLAIAAPN